MYWQTRNGEPIMDVEIGNTIKAYRKQQNLTLQALAEKTELSVSYLSMLERGLNSPTIKNLNVICMALGITLSDLITNLQTADTITVKKDERRVIVDNGGCLYEAASEGRRQMSCVIMTVRDNDVHISSPHIADEIGYVVSGSIMMTVSGVQHTLNPGDCIYIEANQNHGFQKISEEDCVSVWTYGTTASNIEVNDVRASD